MPDSPTIMSVKKIPIERTCAEFWNVEFIPDPTPRCFAGRLFITPARLGAANAPIASPFMHEDRGEHRVREVHRDEQQQQEGERRDAASRRSRRVATRTGPKGFPISVRRSGTLR